MSGVESWLCLLRKLGAFQSIFSNRQQKLRKEAPFVLQLSKGSNFNDCKSTKVCQRPGCMKKHHTLLHIDRQGHNQTPSSTLSFLRLLSPGIRSIEPVTVSSGRSSRSSVSLITKNFAEGLVGHLPESFPILLEGVSTTSTDTAISLDLTIAPYKATAAMPLRNVLAVPTLNLRTFDSAPFSSLCRQYPLLKHVYFLILNHLLSIFSSAQINSTSFIDLL